MAETAVGEYTQLVQEVHNLEAALQTFVNHYKSIKDRLVAINADETLKADVQTVAQKGRKSFASFSTLKTKAKKVRDVMNTEFPALVAEIEEAP